MRTRPRATIEDLRLAVDLLPRHTRLAMLEGMAANPIIAGAYVSADGICPMLAAHRSGGRTSMIMFAEAWDRFVFRDARSARARRATRRELLILKAQLEVSLLEEEGGTGALAAARREHLALTAHRARHRPVRSWARLGRRHGDYEVVIRRLGPQSPTTEPVVREPGARELPRPR